MSTGTNYEMQQLVKYIANTFYNTNKVLSHDVVIYNARNLKEQIPDSYSDIVSEIRNINSRQSRQIVRIMMNIES